MQYKLFLFFVWIICSVIYADDDDAADSVLAVGNEGTHAHSSSLSSSPPRILQYRQTLALPPVVWRAPIGCDNSGFFNEILAFFTGLVPFFEHDKLFLDVGRCSHFESFTDKDTVMIKTLQASFSTSPPKWKDSIVIHHKLPGQAVPPALSSSRYLVGRMMTESTVLSRTEVHQARVLDEVWLPSAFHASVFAAHGVPASKLHVVPEPVDVQFYSDLTKPPRGEVFRFLSVFKYEKRKGVDVLLTSYWKTFEKDDNVELVIRAYKPSWEPGSADLNKVFNNFALKEFSRPMSELASVVWLKSDLSKTDLRALYQSAGVFVLPTRGEGWCLPCAEALAAGTPLIVTNYSGPSAYLSEEHSFPLRHAPRLNADGTAEPDGAHLAQLMQHVARGEAQGELIEKSVKAKAYAAKHFEPSIVALKVIKRLNAINDHLALVDHTEL
jgi:glycosyltransferase involved in cell wall biosynthesis